MKPDRIIRIRYALAFAASCLLHGAFCFVSPSVIRLIPASPPPQPVRVKLSFAAAPERMPEARPTAEPEVISDRDMRAADLHESGLQDEMPHLPGEVDAPALADPFSPGEEAPSPSPTQNAPEETEHEKTAKAEEAVMVLPPEEKRIQPIPEVPRLESARPEGIGTPAESRPLSDAEALAEAAYNARSSEVGRYLKHSLKRISHQWQISLLRSMTHVNARETVVLFQILPSGRIGDLRVIRHKGDQISMRYPLLAIRNVSPFDPLPEEVLHYIRGEGLWWRIKFIYR